MTRRKDMEDLECLIGYLEAECGMAREDIGFGTLDRPNVKRWVAWMSEEKGYSAKTVNLRLTALKSFLRYCSAEDPSLTAEYVGACAVKPPKVARRPVGYLSPDETKAVLAAYSGRTAKERRHRAMLVLLYETGARVSELTGIRASDLSLEAPARVTLMGKGGKWRACRSGTRARRTCACTWTSSTLMPSPETRCSSACATAPGTRCRPTPCPSC